MTIYLCCASIFIRLFYSGKQQQVGDNNTNVPKTKEVDSVRIEMELCSIYS